MANSYYKNFLNLGFLDGLDESDFEDDFDLAVDHVGSKSDVLLKCPECKNNYKTASGLQRHVRSKHINSAPDIDMFDRCTLESLLQKSVDKFVNDGCWPNDIRAVVSNFKCLVMDELLTKVNCIVSKYSTSRDPEKFFEEFYGNITVDAAKYLDMPLSAANIVMIQFGELVFGQLKKFGATDDIKTSPPIMESEVDALQYIAGYVVHIFLKKARNNPTYDSSQNQAIILVLEAMVDSMREQRLVDSLNRGGLTPISRDCELIFYRTEELFRIKTAIPNLRKIDIPTITANLMCQPGIISTINCIVDKSGTNIETELKNNIFEKMIQLYLRVRSFALARDLTSCKKKSINPKGLRKELKRSADGQH